MNEININLNRLKTGKNHSAPKARRLLMQAGGIAFGILERKYMTLLYGFASASLARYIAESQQIKVEDAIVLKQRLIVGPEEEPRLALHLKLLDGCHLTLDCYDHIYHCTPYVSLRDNGRLLSPNKVWGLPAHGYMGFMLLTERMVDFLEDRAKDGQHAHLLRVLWREYEICSKRFSDRQLNIEGEFVEFTARPFAHGLIIFDTA